MADLLNRYAPDDQPAVIAFDCCAFGHEQFLQAGRRRRSDTRGRLLQFAHRASRDQTAAVQHDEVIGEQLDLRKQVARHEHCVA